MKTSALIVLLSFAVTAQAETMFPTPKAAADALADAVAAHDSARVDELFGPDYHAFTVGQQSDPALAKARVERFKLAMKQFRSLARESEDRYTLTVGAVGWPLPVPIVRDGKQWRFDGAEGVEELRNRLVGANELNAIGVLAEYTDAQRQYALRDHDADGVLEYAERVASTPGTHDGLYWETTDDDEETSPLAALKELVDAVLGERPTGAPLLGYQFRSLHSQGAHGKAGAYDYRVNGHMVGGFAMIAWPANYGDTGVMTFIVNQDGAIYQRDLGEDTATAASKVELFDPDPSWTAVDDDVAAGHAQAVAEQP